MGFFKEFKEFALKGNVMDLAIGVIIGGAFGAIVTSLVNDIVMPLVNPLIPGGKWQELTIGPGVKIGSFLSVTLTFFIIAFVLFLVVKGLNSMKKKEETLPQPPPPPSPLTTTDKLLTEIRDALSRNP